MDKPLTRDSDPLSINLSKHFDQDKFTDES